MQTTQLQEVEYEKGTELDSYEITIEANPDRWRGGFVWSVSLSGEEVGSGLEFSRKLAKDAAKKQINQIVCKKISPE